MATQTTYTFSEAVAILAKGKDMKAIDDLGRKYPILVQKTATVLAKAPEFADLAKYFPEYVTANKLNGAIKKVVFGDEGDLETVEVSEPKAAKGKATAKAEPIKKSAGKASGDPMLKYGDDYENMTGGQLWEITGAAGIRKNAKSTKKADILALCIAYRDGAGASDSEDEAGPYDGMTAMELFKECKARKIKAEPKQKAKYYIELLSKAADDADEEEDEGWEEEPEEPKAKSKAKAKPAPAAKKTEKKEKPAADDGDDWDI